MTTAIEFIESLGISLAPLAVLIQFLIYGSGGFLFFRRLWKVKQSSLEARLTKAERDTKYWQTKFAKKESELQKKQEELRNVCLESPTNVHAVVVAEKNSGNFETAQRKIEAWITFESASVSMLCQYAAEWRLAYSYDENGISSIRDAARLSKVAMLVMPERVAAANLASAIEKQLASTEYRKDPFSIEDRRWEKIHSYSKLDSPKQVGEFDRASNWHRSRENYHQFLALRHRIWVILHRELGQYDATTASALHGVGIGYRLTERNDRAISIFKAAIEDRIVIHGQSSVFVAESLNSLGVTHEAMQDYKLAEPLYLEALAIRRKHYGDDDPNVAFQESVLGNFYGFTRDYDRASELLESALNKYEKVRGRRHIDTVNVVNSLAGIRMGQQRLDEAKAMLLEALDGFEREAPLSKKLINNCKRNINIIQKHLESGKPNDQFFSLGLPLQEKLVQKMEKKGVSQ